MKRVTNFLIVGFIIMCFNSLYQYSWNVLEPLIRLGLNANLIQMELAFTLFTTLSTIFQILGGYIADTKGPKKIGMFSSLLSSLGFLGTSFSNSLQIFYFFWSLGSIGEGILYGIAANLAVKWFQSRSGLATGIVTLGFGLGGTIANPLISLSTNFREPTLIIGLIELFILPLLLNYIEYPTIGAWGISPKEVIVLGRWWVLYFSYVLINVPIIVLSSSLTELGENLSKGELLLVLTLFPLASGIGRPILGYLSDKIGRINAAIIVEMIIILGSITLKFNLLIGSFLIGFFGGSLLPIYFSLIGEKFGPKFSTSNNALLYSGKALIGILGSLIFGYLLVTGIDIAFLYIILCSIFGYLLLIFLIKLFR
jgi:OFA family oxalate/formate antiporter-like MFS transporter